MTSVLPVGDLTIGALAKQVGCRAETVRYYERVGLMPAPPRSAGGHRLYNEDDLKRMTFIRRGRGLGFTVAEVRSLLELVDSGVYTCAEVKDLTLAHRSTIRQKITDLERLDAALGDMAARCEGGTGQDCVVLDSLFGQRLVDAEKDRA